MCGIVGYVGGKQAAPILMDGLKRLEYRGYDSAGLAVRQGDGRIEVVKAKGRLSALAEKIDGGRTLQGTCGIGHTRWATHGEPSERNAHPHCSDDMAVVAVHNGIIASSPRRIPRSPSSSWITTTRSIKAAPSMRSPAA